MKRVMIFGGSGSGKSTLARRVGEITGLPVIHIDPMYYRAGWAPRSKDETRALVLAATAKEAWVFDGNHHSTFEARIARADHAIFLDLPTWLRVWRVMARWWRYRGQTRPDMAANCPERLSLYFVIYWVGGYYWRTRPKDAGLMQALPPHIAAAHLKSRGAVAAFLNELQPKAETARD
ncbi:MAG: AAA family ATPase [Rhodobacteraceae bacterium]|nr:AAA family ATPase [Paracoccaceae bacterium]